MTSLPDSAIDTMLGGDGTAASKLKPLGVSTKFPKSVPTPLPGCNSYKADTTWPPEGIVVLLSILGLKYPKLSPPTIRSCTFQLPDSVALMTAASALLAVLLAPYNVPGDPSSINASIFGEAVFWAKTLPRFHAG